MFGFVSRYPPGYTIMFIPYYSTVYRRSYGHWAVYNERQEFYGFDDGDATEDFYDYDSGDGLPAGCNFTDPGQDILGNPDAPLDLSMLSMNATDNATPGPAPAGGAAPAPEFAVVGSALPLPAVPALSPAAAGSDSSVPQRFVSLQAQGTVQGQVAAPTAMQGIAAGGPQPQPPAPNVAALPQGFGPFMAPAPAPDAGYSGAAMSITCDPIPTRTQGA